MQNVANWSDSVDVVDTYLSAITILEIELGCQQIARRDKKQAKSLRRWFDDLLKVYESRVIAIDIKVALRAASLHVPAPKPDRDALIAASALEHGYHIVTRNVDDFVDCNVSLVNPWSKT